MQREWFEHRNLPWDPAPPVPFRVAGPRAGVSKPSVTVMGYLPYWNIGKPSLVLHFDRLHVLAYFGASLESDGEVGDIHHWGSDVLTDLIAQAHASGVLVVLTVTNFNPASMAAFLSSQSSRSAAVSNLVALVVSAGGDGVNVDFEGLPKANKADFVAFIHELHEAFDAALERSHVSIATPAVDFSGAFDYDQLAEASDALFIMGYAYHWSGGPPGPVSPLYPSATWGKHSLSWTIDGYIASGGDKNRPKFILGLPLYGFDWPTTGPDIPGTATGKGEARFYARCRQEAAMYGEQWDEESSTPYYIYQDNGWHQVWCENRHSLALKYALVSDRELGGVGFWALGYEEDFDEVWEELGAAFPPALPPPDGMVSDVTADTGWEAHVEAPDTALWEDSLEWETEPQRETAPDPATLDLSPETAPPPSAGCTSLWPCSGQPQAGPAMPPLVFLTMVLVHRLIRRTRARWRED